MDTRLGITGASGQLGQLVLAELLDERGVAPARIVAMTRDPAKLADLAARGVEVRRADFDAPAELAEAFAGIDRLLLISTDDIFPKGTRVRQHTAAVAAAVAAGVGHLIYTSASNPQPPNPMFWEEDHWLTEEAIRASGCTWTLLRNSEYMEVHLERHWPQALASGTMHTISGDGRCAYVSRVDCARAAAAALDGAPGENVIHDITGPEALTTEAALAIVAAGTGREIRVVQTTEDEYRRILTEAGQPDWLIPCWIALDQGIAQGFFDDAGDGVQQLTGVTATSLEAVVARMTALGLVGASGAAGD